ncbi:GspMb/PilO family protein [Poriferisphaera sp. WC338]|uniref:GspMb/PilO family protein n=1 Tax=Poriferisphaera sp. WC338 TaxID=3425129 RepID=UPI003D815B32
MTKREKRILYLTLVVIVLFVGNQFVLSPYENYVAGLEQRKHDLTVELGQVQNTLKKSKTYQTRYKRMRAMNLLQSQSSAESLAINEIRDGAQDSKITLLSVKPEHAKPRGAFTELIVNLSAQGDVQSVTRFLYEIETAELPFRVDSLQLSSRSADEDALNVQAKVSFLYEKTQQKKGENAL